MSRQNESKRIGNRSRVLWILAISQALTLLLVGLMAHHYRIPQKAWRSLTVEKRIPGITSVHELNRNFQPSRDLFRCYRDVVNPILIFGDSHVRLVSWNELLGRDDIANRGIDGDTLAGVSARLADEADAHPVAVVIFVGTNDLLRGTPVNEMRTTTENLVAEARRLWPESRLLLTTVPPVATWRMDYRRINAEVKEFNRWLVGKAAASPYSALIDFSADLQDPQGNLAPMMTTDGVHLSSGAYKLFCRRLEEALN